MDLFKEGSMKSKADDGAGSSVPTVPGGVSNPLKDGSGHGEDQKDVECIDIVAVPADPEKGEGPKMIQVVKLGKVKKDGHELQMKEVKTADGGDNPKASCSEIEWKWAFWNDGHGELERSKVVVSPMPKPQEKLMKKIEVDLGSAKAKKEPEVLEPRKIFKKSNPAQPATHSSSEAELRWQLRDNAVVSAPALHGGKTVDHVSRGGPQDKLQFKERLPSSVPPSALSSRGKKMLILAKAAGGDAKEDNKGETNPGKRKYPDETLTPFDNLQFPLNEAGKPDAGKMGQIVRQPGRFPLFLNMNSHAMMPAVRVGSKMYLRCVCGYRTTLLHRLEAHVQAGN